ncbi:MAG: ubiquitin-like domain-containing protein [Anaerolineaceae bacterium]
MTRKTKLIILIFLTLIGIIAGYLLMGRQLTITVDGESSQVMTHALTVRGALRSIGVNLTPLDQVSPPASSSLSKITEIKVQLSHPIQVWNDSTKTLTAVDTAATTPAEILVTAGILPGAGDAIRLNGLVVPMDQPLNIMGSFVLQYTPAISLDLNLDGVETSFYTAAFSVGTALWEKGINIHGGDALSQSFTGSVDAQSALMINKARSLIITADGKDISTYATAASVGEVLAKVGVSLQDLDYSKPAESDPLPEDGRIFVVRVREEVLREQQSIPFTTTTQTDDTMESGQTQTITAGENGLQVATVRIRYEDGEEVSRETEETIVLKEPVTAVVVAGSKLVVSTIQACDVPVNYYKAVTVTATSYSPCNSGSDTCLPKTAMGTTVKKGVLAVDSTWWPTLKGTQICVPGYGIGVVQDTGSYPGTHHWIDLGYTDAEFAAAGQLTFYNLTVYLLGPFPEGTNLELP